MKRIAAAIAAPVLAIGLAACGGGDGGDGENQMSKAEQKAADSLAQQFSGGSGQSEGQQEFGRCTGERLVEGIGLEKLKQDKLIDKNNEAVQGQQQPELSESTASGVATAIMECNDWEDQAKALKKDGSLQGSDKQVDAFVECAKDVDKKDYHAMLMMSVSQKHGDQKAAQRGAQAFQKCQVESGLMPSQGQQGGGQQGGGQQDAPADQ